MVVAMYKSNCKSAPEHIRVHKYEGNGELHIESITNSYAHEIGGAFKTLEEVEAYLKKRDRVFGYTLIIKR